MTLFSGFATLATLLIFVIDLALFGVVRNRYKDRGIPAQYGIGNWLVAGALGALLVGFCASACGIFGRYGRRRKDVL